MTPSRQMSNANPARNAVAPEDGARSDVVVFVEKAALRKSSLRHAQNVAGVYGGKVVLVHVQCPVSDGDSPVDPVEWDMQKQQSLKWLKRLTQSSDLAGAPCEAQLLEGHCETQIQSFLEERQSDIAATVRFRDSKGWQSSQTACGVLLSHNDSVMVIPEAAEIAPGALYRRILVPLDGSARAETALPKAVMLALAQGGELMLCYVAPEPGLTEFGVRDQEAERLQDMVRKRNEQAGKSYLTRVRNGLAQSGLTVTTQVSGSGDARRDLIDVIARQNVDFVVMATHGQGGHSDVPIGDVARFLLDSAEVPILLVRYAYASQGKHAFDKFATAGTRQPAGTC